MSGRQRNGAPVVQCSRAVLLLLIGLVVLGLYTAASLSNISGGIGQSTVVALTSGPHGNLPFPKKIVHLDLKGAPLKISYYEWFFEFIRGLGVDGLLLEYEDIFPYHGNLTQLSRSSGHYSVDDIRRLNSLAEANGLEVIPLVQTFGHLEFALKHSPFVNLRENAFEDDSICISEPQTMNLIREMIYQIRELHPTSWRIHIGADEAYHVGEDLRCIRELRGLGERPRSLERLKIRHISRVAKLCKEMHFTDVFAWNDMFATTLVEDMKAADLGNLITPVVWGYAVDVLKKDYFPDGLFHRLSQVFDKIWFASAFKGANGKDQAFMTVERYLQNHRSYVDLYRQFAQDLNGRVQGIMMTGWQRYKHRLPLCELLPVSIPSLVINSVFLNDVLRPSGEMNRIAKTILNCTTTPRLPVFEAVTIGNYTYFPQKDNFFANCNFHDSELFKLVMNDLRLLTWKVNHFSLDVRRRKDIDENIARIELELKNVLSNYYDPPDVDEIMTQYVETLKHQLP